MATTFNVCLVSGKYASFKSVNVYHCLFRPFECTYVTVFYFYGNKYPITVMTTIKTVSIESFTVVLLSSLLNPFQSVHVSDLSFCHRVAGILSKQHILPVPKPILWENQWSCHGIPASPIVANIYMKAFEFRAINTALSPQGSGGGMLMTLLWFNISHTRRGFSNASTQWILPSSSLWKKLELMWSIPFLDILVTTQTDGTFTTKVYRKLTQINLYLQWDSHDNHAANTVWSTPSYTGPVPYVLHHSYSLVNYNT